MTNITGGSAMKHAPPCRDRPIAIRASNWTEADMRSADMRSTDTDILKAAEEWRRGGRDVALATVVETWGSAPRPVGSNLVIDGDGNFLGSVSGGCVEGAVVTEALDVIESGEPKMLEFGVADETAWKVGLSCGGTIRVYVEKVE
jgi:xanthine/CO dehydrogenase XdhC/CoxF family maturation factor